MNKVTASTALSNYAKYVPLIVPVVLVVLQALIDNGSLHLAAQNLTLIDAILGALGLHALHIRTK
jgi:hypothetical protein